MAKSLFSPRAIEVFQLLKTDKTYREIAAQLGVKLETVRTHMRQIRNRSGVRQRHALVTWGITNHFIK